MTRPDLRERLRDHADSAPPLGFAANDIVARGTLARRRRRAGGFAAAAVLALVATGTTVALTGRPAPDDVADPPASPDDTATDPTDPPTTRPVSYLATSPQDLPRVLRDLAAEALPGAEETIMRPSTWEIPRRASLADLYAGGAGDLPLPRSDEATEWVARFDRDDSTFSIITRHVPPDEGALAPLPLCRATTADYRCEARDVDGGTLVEMWERVVQPDQPTRLEHTIIVFGDDATEHDVQEIRRGDGSLANGWQVSSADLEAFATDPRLAFPLPDPAPRLPSITYCVFGTSPAGGGDDGCPA